MEQTEIGYLQKVIKKIPFDPFNGYFFIKICITLLSLACMGWISIVSGPKQLIYYNDVHNKRTIHGNPTVLVSTAQVLFLDKKQRVCIVVKKGSEIQIEGLPEDSLNKLSPGVYIDVLGRYRGGILELEELHIQRERYSKVYGSILAVIFVFYMFLRNVILPLLRGVTHA